MHSDKPQNSIGQALVEFALVIVVLSFVLMGIFDFGRVIYTTTSLSNAAREGARVGTVTGDTGSIQDAVISKGIGLGIQPTQIFVSYPSGGRSIGATIKVSINDYPFTTITPLVGRFLGPSDTMNLSTSASMYIEKP